MKKQHPPSPELSRPLRVDHVPLGGIREHIVATPLECKALATRFGLEDLSQLEAVLNVDRAQSGMFSVTGYVQAHVTQSCVVTLEPVFSEIHEPVRVLFAPPHLIKSRPETGILDYYESEDPEPIEQGKIDLGELAAQCLCMALNPYPRKEGASFEEK
ncbi:MAG: DUF177 domain-containing protein [Alphaproteobacteria bacterium]|nr:DUF177 domain-containing protein [Alphaproteobacteria bacterium]